MRSVLLEIGRNGEIDQAVDVFFGIGIAGNLAAVDLQGKIEHDVQNVVEKHPDVGLFAESILEAGEQGSKTLAVADMGVFAEIGRIEISDIGNTLFTALQQELPNSIEIGAAAIFIGQGFVVHHFHVGHRNIEKLDIQRFVDGGEKILLVGKDAVDIRLVKVGAADDRLGGGVLKPLGCDDFDGVFDQPVTDIKVLQNKSLPLLEKSNQLRSSFPAAEIGENEKTKLFQQHFT